MMEEARGATVPVDLSTRLGEVTLRNPVLTASGTFGYGSEFAPFLDLTKLGGFVAKSLTLEPRWGNPPPRIAEVRAGMLNSISLENVGVDAFLAEKLPALPEGTAVVASAFGTAVDQYAEVCRRLTDAPGVVAIEVNASCPHVAAGGIEFGQDPVGLARLVAAARAATTMPLWVKLSPNVTSIADMARVCEAEGANAVSLINAIQALDVDIETRRPVLANGLGGFSGPAILPIALRMVWQAAQAVDIPICGIGGITSAEDVVKFLLCGASAVQVGTLNYLNPMAGAEIVDGLQAYCERAGIQQITELIGALDFPSR
jgi:dihydroorotate dehydrogenase (NAD+) catalytic subunit